MRVVFSDDCEIATYLYGIVNFTVRINGEDYQIKNVDHDGLAVWVYQEDERDLETDADGLFMWDSIDELYIY